MFDFTSFFYDYEALAVMADRAFNRVNAEYPDAVRCTLRCSDCCHAVFDLTLIEAMYINDRFHKKFDSSVKEHLMERANKADRLIFKLRRQIRKEAMNDLQKGKDPDRIMAEVASKMGQIKVRCPMLNDQDICEIYEFRPISCRVDGIPTSIWGKGHTCGKSGFIPGQTYPTVNIDAIRKKLFDISHELLASAHSKDLKAAGVTVPMSTVILTSYNEEYLQLPVIQEDNPHHIEPSGESDG